MAFCLLVVINQSNSLAGDERYRPAWRVDTQWGSF